MNWELLQIDDTGSFVVRSVENPKNRLALPDLRDLLRLRARLDQYLADLQPDTIIDNDEDDLSSQDAQEEGQPAQDDYISVAAAFDLAEAQGYTIPRTSLKSAVYRGTIPGSVRKGNRWRIPRAAFERWLQEWSIHRE